MPTFPKNKGFNLKSKGNFDFGNKGNFNFGNKRKINQSIVASGVDKNFMTNKVKRAQGKEITVK